MNITISITELMLFALIFLALIILVWVIYEILGNVNKKFDEVDQRLKNLEDRANMAGLKSEMNTEKEKRETIANLKEAVDRLEKKNKKDQKDTSDKKDKD